MQTDWTWADTEMFGKKLQRYMQQTEDKISLYPHILALLHEGTEIADELIQSNIHGMLSQIEEIQERIDAVDGLVKRIRTIAEEDQPSQ